MPCATSAATGFPIGVRLPGIEFVEGGLDVADVCSIAQRLEQWGVAYVNVSSGNYTGLAHGAQLAYVASSYTPPAPTCRSRRRSVPRSTACP